MDNRQSIDSDKGVRRSGSNRASLPRRSTRGPLDIADSPISPQSLNVPRAFSPRRSPTRSPRASPSIGAALESADDPLSASVIGSEPSAGLGITGTLASGAQAAVTSPSKDFSYLLRPEIYHPLTPADLPLPFRNSPHQPPASTPLADLLASGHFRSAAIFCARELTSNVSPTDYTTIFNLLYTRLACLTLTHNTQLAAQEVKALEDLNAAYYRDDLNPHIHLVPWELRILAVRLQGMGFNDPRRAVTGYYDLARDARSQLSLLKSATVRDEGLITLWMSRLHDLGLRVAAALVVMGDLETAARHLRSMKPLNDTADLAFAQALLWLRIGDVEAAKSEMEKHAQGRLAAQVIDGLSAMADGKYELAAELWKNLCAGPTGDAEEDPERGARAQEMAMLKTNHAVALLYAGKMEDAREVLGALVEEVSFPTLTFNLCTIYELCTEKSRALKMTLAEKLATQPGTSVASWEKAVADLKL